VPVGQVQGEQLGPGDEFAGERDDGAPDAVLGEGVQREVGQAGVFGLADAAFAAGSAAVPELEVGKLGARSAGRGVGRGRR